MQTRQDFIDALMPYAIEASQRTGIDPRIIIAQSAQETGWGRHAPGNNYFGIKSHGKGGGQTFTTHEVINGQRIKINDSFRRYGGIGDSVRGYADFMLDNPRYRPMREAEGLDAQLAALGSSGYATDPNYASSVGSIARSITYNPTANATNNPKNPQGRPVESVQIPNMVAQFNPEAAGATLLDVGDNFDPMSSGAELIEGAATVQPTPLEGPDAPAPLVAEFEAQIADMDEIDLSIARSKNDPLGEYLRSQVDQRRPGETEEAYQQRLYGSLPDSNADALEGARTFTRGMVEGVPIAGPALLSGVENVAAGIDAVTSDRTFAESKKKAGEIRRMDKMRNPVTDTAGQVTGAVAPMMALGATALGGRALGVTGPSLTGRIGASGVSTGVISGADTAARGGSSDDIAQSSAIGTGIGSAIPFLGAGLNALGRGVRSAIGTRVSAPHRVKAALDADIASGQVISPADDAAAAASGQRLLNIDRGGEATRALARSAANVDPNARAIIERTASDRFASQYGRAQEFITRIVGNVDDVSFRENLTEAARIANKPLYAKARNSPAAKSMWDSEFERFMQAPAVQQAVRGAMKKSGNRAVIEGSGVIRNPFRDVDGTLTMKEGVTPNLDFWNAVKIELDDMIGVSRRAGERSQAADLTQIKRLLVNKLDEAVPEYAAARAGAARFFEAEDALDAGKKFVSQNKDIREAAKAVKKMTPEERKAFAVGFSGELLEKMGNVRDRANVIDRVWGNPNARAKIELAIGKKRARELEQFARIETIMDKLRGAMGNSTTARQLQELGLAGGAGVSAGYLTNDWQVGLMVGLGTRGARYAGDKVSEGVAKRVAKLLISEDPKDLQKAISLASNNPRFAKALQYIQTGIGLSLRGEAGYELRPDEGN